MKVLTMIDIKTLREKAKTLDPQFALVGFFGATRREETLLPLSDVTCCCLTRSPRIRRYKSSGTTHPAMLATVPVIYNRIEGQVHIGGPDWYWIVKEDKRVYTRQRQFNPVTRVEATRPVGVLRDLFEEDTANSMCLDESRNFNLKLMTIADEMLSASPDNTPCFNQWGDRSPTVPTFLSPISPRSRTRSYMKLRRGTALDEQVLHCAETGEWGIPGLHTLSAPDHGVLKGVSHGAVELWVPLDKTTEEDLRGMCKVDSGYRVEDGYEVSTIRNPTIDVERRIYEVFGVNFCPTYFPVIQKGQALQVRAGRAMFIPVPRQRWTLNELKARPDYEALCYAAALHDTYEHEGVEMLDLSYAYNPVKEPWVDMSGMARIQKILFSAPEQGKNRNTANLACKGDGYELDLLNISLRVEMRRKVKQKEEQKRLEAKQAEAPQQPAPAVTVATASVQKVPKAKLPKTQPNPKVPSAIKQAVQFISDVVGVSQYLNARVQLGDVGEIPAPAPKEQELQTEELPVKQDTGGDAQSEFVITQNT